MSLTNMAQAAAKRQEIALAWQLSLANTHLFKHFDSVVRLLRGLSQTLFQVTLWSLESAGQAIKAV